MRTTLFILLVSLGVGPSAFGQGTIIFNNNGRTRITNFMTGQAATGLTVALYYALNGGGGDDSNLILDPFAVTNTLSGAAAGIFLGGIRPVPGTRAGYTIVAQIRAWSGSYASYEDALGGGAALIGKSNVFLVGPLGEGLSPPPLIYGGDPYFDDFLLRPFHVFPIPEPAMPALGILGLILMRLYSRKSRG